MANVCDLACMLLIIFVSAAASFFIPEVVTVGPDGYKIALIVFFFLGLCYLLVQLGYFLYLLRDRGPLGIICDDVDLRHELNGLWNKVMLVCSKDKSGYDFTEEMNQYELRRLSLLLESSVIGDTADGSVNRPVLSEKAKHSTLNLDLVRLAKDRAVPLECLSSGVASLGRWEEVNKYRSQILEDTRNFAARVRQLASETSPIPLEDSSWIRQFPRATILWGTEAYVTDAKVPLGRAWQQRCRQRQSDILELEADPRCVVALGMLDLSSAFAELESRFRVNPRERLNARRRLERQLKAKTKSKPEAESTSGPTSSTAEGHPNA
ncbi:hypothetical protein FOZ63_027680 [Perkinsus olseni]|uniref:Uncharacterized protein n=1 Tax=Perkinsus olseni TaxID=32597 RepID=A0A7J6PEE9_PEROL|nr:hypothetical protein FOZ63_027680 [Perkinsus olseni]